MDGIQKTEKLDNNTYIRDNEFKNLINKKENINNNNNFNNICKSNNKTSLNENSKLIKTNNAKIAESFVSDSLIKTQKRHSNIENINSNFKFGTNKKIASKPLKINDQEYYKNFFMLTYQAIKLNSEDIDVFEHVKFHLIAFIN